jgi:hypothetical protein
MDFEQRAVLGDARVGGVCKSRQWRDPGGWRRIGVHLGVLERGLKGFVDRVEAMVHAKIQVNHWVVQEVVLWIVVGVIAGGGRADGSGTFS